MTARVPRVSAAAETAVSPQSPGGPSQSIDSETRAKPRPGRKSPPKAEARAPVRAVTISTPLLDEPYVPAAFEEAVTRSADHAGEVETESEAKSYPPTN